jgi:hypothetical protein
VGARPVKVAFYSTPGGCPISKFPFLFFVFSPYRFQFFLIIYQRWGVGISSISKMAIHWPDLGHDMGLPQMSPSFTLSNGVNQMLIISTLPGIYR